MDSICATASPSWLAGNTLMVIFPSDWERRWPEFAASVKSYRKEGNNMHDDAEDVLTGIIERGSLIGGASDAQILSDFL